MLRYTLGSNRREETPNGIILGHAPEKPSLSAWRSGAFAAMCGRSSCFGTQPILICWGDESLLISGDFPSPASRGLEAGGNPFGLFINGSAGNIRTQDACDQLTALSSDLRLDALSGEIHLPFVLLPNEDEVANVSRQQERVVRPDERLNHAVEEKLQKAVAYASYGRL